MNHSVVIFCNNTSIKIDLGVYSGGINKPDGYVCITGKFDINGL